MKFILKAQKKLKFMEKLTGNKINSAVFISGTGTNLKSIIKNSKKNFHCNHQNTVQVGQQDMNFLKNTI